MLRYTLLPVLLKSLKPCLCLGG